MIEVGDRGKVNKKHYVTSYANAIGRKPAGPTAHPGITAYRNRWLSYQMGK